MCVYFLVDVFDSAGPFAQVVTAFGPFGCVALSGFPDWSRVYCLSLSLFGLWRLLLIWCIHSFFDFTLVSKLTLSLMVVVLLVVIVWDYH